MKRIDMFVFQLLFLSLGLMLWSEAAPGQSAAVDVHRITTTCSKLVQQGRSCQERKNYDCTQRAYEAARLELEKIPPTYRDQEVLNLLWYVYSGLGLYGQAKELVESADSTSGTWQSEWNSMKDSYGSIRLESKQRVLRDPTLAIESVRVLPGRGAPREFPYDVVRDRAAAEILRAFQQRDLITDPIYLPAGKEVVEFHLERESALNYHHPDLSIELEVKPGEEAVCKVDPDRRVLPKAILAGVGAAIVLPIVLIH